MFLFHQLFSFRKAFIGDQIFFNQFTSTVNCPLFKVEFHSETPRNVSQFYSSFSCSWLFLSFSTCFSFFLKIMGLFKRNSCFHLDNWAWCNPYSFATSANVLSSLRTSSTICAFFSSVNRLLFFMLLV